MAALSSDTLESIIALIQQRLSPLAIYLYGSQARGQAQPDSDLDIAVLGAAPYDPWDLFTLAQELVALQETFQNHPPTEVDLVDLAAASPLLRAIVVSQGRRAFCADRLRCDLFEIRALKEYANLQEERRPIIEDIRRRGRVYG
ncbi:type VII toxin-antitoxin system MntA family adenylyltransferase antitoxin [Meiothermus ruber]|uniref:DNA polymerase beta domain protein region n=1 Tax=Meiothermus ruber (strain ATCC 35948 / DSM 1279 / VKM B-1258 / 21) TaxID=504728 RepID=D3PQ32_MEIRD|nr:nucleotidyltransferase domain-containing protein [Meiothermus ruber]ADD27658.1 DNA polymerase beta domain protein region [Meiothermus ruber DSM 1279]AGK04123.1 DNA polymerase beta domain-containing protein [Meiothermus ruber DSM 1279]